MVTPLLELVSAMLASGWKLPLSKTNWPGLEKPAGLPPRLVWEQAWSVVPKGRDNRPGKIRGVAGVNHRSQSVGGDTAPVKPLPFATPLLRVAVPLKLRLVKTMARVLSPDNPKLPGAEMNQLLPER